MSINPDKTESIIFSRKKVKMLPLMKVLNFEVLWSNKVKYLRVTLDAGLRFLRWGPAIQDRITKANATLSTLYPLINKKSMLRQKFKLLL